MADVKDTSSGVASTSTKSSGNMANKGGQIATGFISAVGSVVEDTVHAVGNVGVTTIMEATRVLTTTAIGIRQAVGSAISGHEPDFAEQHRKENEYRQSH